MLEAPHRICPAGSISADLAAFPPDLQAVGQRYLAGQQRWLQATLERGAWEQDSSELADTVLAALQGGLQRARVAGDPQRLTAVIHTLEHLLGGPDGLGL